MSPQENRKYLKLIRQFPLRPVRSEAEMDAAIEVIDSLLDQSTLSEAEQDYLDVLGTLVEKFKSEHYPMREVSDDRMLRHLIEAKVFRQSATCVPSSSVPCPRGNWLHSFRVGIILHVRVPTSPQQHGQ